MTAGERAARGADVSDTRAARIASAIEPLRVKPRSSVELERDFDPRYKADFVKKKENGITVVKLFLNLSKEAQRCRFLKRIDLAEKSWRFSSSDILERNHWDEYQHAFSEMLSATSTPWAPWYVVAADRKWFARICVSAILAHTLIEIDPKYPTVDGEKLLQLRETRTRLEAEAPAGAAPDPVAARLANRDGDGDHSGRSKKHARGRKPARVHRTGG